jgi:peptidoglycan/xylan/chitin deacetylase (PgdA/CDA1 family)
VTADVLVLCYHAVSPTWRATFSVTPDTLERQLTLLVRRGWQGATFSDAVLDPPAAKTLAVTFDDGFASVLECAEPILSSLGLVATVFAPTSFMSDPQHLRWEGIEAWHASPEVHELRCMGWDALGQLAERGWEIGSHTRTHPHLRRLSDDALRAELRESREQVARHVPRGCRSLAYPYGEVDARIARMAEDAGYAAGACLSHSLAQRGPYLWPRVGVFHDDFDLRFRLKISSFTRSVRGSRLGRSSWVQPLRTETHRST